MSRKPNNLPREGMHSTVTRAGIKRLQSERPTPKAEMHYTIGGTVETVVHSNVNAEREAAITAGSRRLEQSSRDLRADFKHPQGDARAAYVREQRALAQEWRACSRGKDVTR